MADPTEMAVEDLSAAARELDRAVHREIFGGEVTRHPPDFGTSSDLMVPLPGYTVASGQSLPRYANDLSHAWRIVEYLGGEPEGLPESVHARFEEILRDHDPSVFEMPERVAAEMICRAALRAARNEGLTMRGKCPECGEKMEQVGYRERPGDGRAEEVYLCEDCDSEPTVFAPLPVPV